MFLDQMLCNEAMVSALGQLGLIPEPHFKHFSRERQVLDDEWLEFVGEHRWVAIGRDRKLLNNELAQQQLLRGRVGYFLLVGREGDGDQAWANAILGAGPEIVKLIHTQRRPFVATVTGTGRVRLRLDSEGNFYGANEA